VTPLLKRTSRVAAVPSSFPPPHGLDQIKMAYGDIRVNAGQVVAPRDWESDNMIMVFDLPGVPCGVSTSTNTLNQV
jgi:hypothetical protein